MTEVIHEHESRNSNNMGMLLGLLLIVILAVLFFVYGLPMIQQSATPQVNVPEQVDVNVNTPNQ